MEDIKTLPCSKHKINISSKTRIIMKRGYSSVLRAIVVISVLILTAILVYSPHFDYRFPLHFDEWYHLNEGVKVLDGIYEPRFRFNQGFHFFLAGIFALEKAVGINVLLAYRFLPAIFVVLASLALFLLVTKIEKDDKNNFWIGILAMLFFASLKSNVNILGPIFAIPFTLSIYLCFTYFYFFIDLFDFGNKKKKEIKGFNKNMVFAIFYLMVLSIIHVSIALIVLVTSFFFALLNHRHTNKKIYAMFILPLLIMVFSLIFFIYTHYGESLSWKINLFIDSFIKSSQYRIDLVPIMNVGKESLLGSPYVLPLFYGIIPFIFAIIGLYYCLPAKKQKLFVIWFIVAMIILFLSEYKLFPSYQRVFYFALLPLPAISAIGLYRFIRKAHSSIVSSNKKNKRAKLQRAVKIVSILALSLLIFLIFFESIKDYNKRPKQLDLYYLINEDDFSALNFLSDKIIDGTIITPKNLVPAVYPATGHHPIVVWNTLRDEKFDYLAEFFDGDCIKKEEFSKRYNSIFAISLKKIECPFMSLVYNERNRFVYKIKK